MKASSPPIIHTHKLLWFFTLIYCMVIIASNWFDARLIRIPFSNLDTDAGTLIFPLSFIISNIITEVYGYKYARRAIWCALLLNLFVIFYGQIIIRMPSPAFADNAAFDQLIKVNTRIVIASMVSYICAEPLDSYIMSMMKIHFRRYLASRFLLSTIISALVDSFIFIFLAFYADFKLHDLIHLATGVWVIKIMIELFGLPLSLWIVQKLKDYEEMDIVDRYTRFGIFSLETSYRIEENEYKTQQQN